MRSALTACIVVTLGGFGLGAQPAYDRTKVEREVMVVLGQFFDAFNHRDAKAEQSTYHFPHYRLAAGQMSVLDSPGSNTESSLNQIYKDLAAQGWSRSTWTGRVLQMSPRKVHIGVEVTRYRADGSVMGVFESLYVLTDENGKWGIKLRSSFAER